MKTQIERCSNLRGATGGGALSRSTAHMGHTLRRLRLLHFHVGERKLIDNVAKRYSEQVTYLTLLK